MLNKTLTRTLLPNPTAQPVLVGLLHHPKLFFSSPATTTTKTPESATSSSSSSPSSSGELSVQRSAGQQQQQQQKQPQRQSQAFRGPSSSNRRGGGGFPRELRPWFNDWLGGGGVGLLRDPDVRFALKHFMNDFDRDLAWPDWSDSRDILAQFPGQQGDSSSSSMMAWPRADVRESDKDYHVQLEVPGFNKADINVRIEGDNLILSGTHNEEKTDQSSGEEGERKWRRRERRVGSFVRTFALPDDADPDSIKASLKDGLLAIDILKHADSSKKGKNIEIA